jgi:hypothetical protein
MACEAVFGILLGPPKGNVGVLSRPEARNCAENVGDAAVISLKPKMTSFGIHYPGFRLAE